MFSNDNSPKALPTTRAEATSWAMDNQLMPKHMVTMMLEIDATAIQQLRDNYKLKGLMAPSMTAIVIKAAAMTMKAFPQANRAILGWPGFRRLYQFKNIDISVAVEKNLPYLPGQAFATPIENSLEKPLESISQELRDLAICTEDNNPRYQMFMRLLRWVPTPISLFLINLPNHVASMWVQHRGCAAWVNAPSKSGADSVATTWPWPISFSFGFVKKRPFVVNDKIEARLTMPLVMVFDRRIMGGGPAGRVFAHFKTLLENADTAMNEFAPEHDKIASKLDQNETVSN